jgi:sortase A
MKRKLGITFIVLGIALVLFAATLLVYNNFESKKAREQSNALMSTLVDSISENKLDPSELDPFDTQMKVVDIDGYGYIGYLSIPDLNLELPVMSEWDYDRLKIAPCRYYGSTKTDNLVIAAHNYKSHFGYIGQLKPGNNIAFTDMEGQQKTYIVTSIETLEPYATDKVKDTGDDLILYTCTYGGASRIVIRCSEYK